MLLLLLLQLLSLGRAAKLRLFRGTEEPHVERRVTVHSVRGDLGHLQGHQGRGWRCSKVGEIVVIFGSFVCANTAKEVMKSR